MATRKRTGRSGGAQPVRGRVGGPGPVPVRAARTSSGGGSVATRKPASVISAKPVRGKPASPGKASAPGQAVKAAVKTRNAARPRTRRR
jgi:hypothetical protein